MAEAELRIRPTVAGSARGALGRDVAALRSVDRQQQRAITAGVRGTRRLERGWNTVARAGKRTASMVGTVTKNLFSMRTAVGAFLAGGAGKTFIEQTIGRASETNRATKLLGAVLKDQDKVNDAVRQARDLTKEIASVDVGQAIQGIEKTINLAGGSVDRAKELVKVAKALEASTPGQGFEDAIFSLKELESGDVVSLRSRFGIRLPTRAEAKKEAKKAKKTLKQFYFDELIGFIDNRFGESGSRLSGVETLLQIDRESLPGQIAMLKTEFSSLFEQVGTEAQRVASRELPSLVEEIQKLKADPQFREDIREISKSLADATKSTIRMAKELPGAIRSVRDFMSEHGTLLKVGGGAFAANRLTGGALGRGAASARGSLARRALFGGGGGGIASSVAGASGGAMPVFVVNMGEGGMGGDGFFGRTSKVLGKGAPLTTAGLLKSGGLTGAAASVGAGGALGLLGIPATFGAAFLTLQHAAEGTSSALQKLNAEADRRESGIRSGSVKARADRARREALTAQRSGLRQEMTGGFRSRIDRAILEGDQGRKRELVQQAVGATTQRLKAARSKEERATILAALDKEIAGFGVEAEFSRGQLKFRGDSDATDERLKARGDIFSRELNSVRPQFNITMQQTDDSTGDGRKLGDAAWKRWQELEEEAARQQAKIGDG